MYQGRWGLIFSLGTLIFATSAFADGQAPEGLDRASKEALAETQRMLTSPGLRSTTIQNDQNAKTHDAGMRNAFGDARTEDIYKLSSEVMDKLVKDTGGDPMKMMEIMAKAQRDPASMKQHFSPEQLQKIQEMAKQIDAQKKP